MVWVLDSLDYMFELVGNVTNSSTLALLALVFISKSPHWRIKASTSMNHSPESVSIAEESKGNSSDFISEAEEFVTCVEQYFTPVDAFIIAGGDDGVVDDNKPLFNHCKMGKVYSDLFVFFFILFGNLGDGFLVGYEKELFYEN